jgi:transcriptional regulator with XRE-family HTH domain
MTARQILGANIRVFRLAMGLSQEGLAEVAGLHRTYMGSVERGERNVSFDNICRIAAALRCAPAALFAGIAPPERIDP